MFGSIGTVRGKVSASFIIKKCIVCEHMEIMCVSTQCHHINKKMDISIKRCYAVKFCVRVKK